MRCMYHSMLIAAAAVLLTAAPQPGLSIKIDKETAPPGGMVQMKVLVTEPTPISTGGTKLMLDETWTSSIEGIGAFSPAGDVYATAVVKGTSVSFRVLSPSGSFGMTPDYPVLTVAARLRGTTPLGEKLTLGIDPATIAFANSFGVTYPAEVKQGQVTIATGVSVFDVRPGSGLVPAGGVITITGMNFSPLTSVQLSEASVSDIKFVNATRIDVTLAAATQMHGMRVRLSNPDGSKATYFAYQRTKPVLPSSVPLLARTVPVFAPKRASLAAFVIPRLSATQWFGVAAANLSDDTAQLVFKATLPGGKSAATATIALPPNTRTARSVAELFQVVLPSGATIQMSASVPVETMAMIGDSVTEQVFPVPPVSVR